MKKIFFFFYLILLCNIVSSIESSSQNYKIDFIVKPSMILNSKNSVANFILNPLSNPETKGYLYKSVEELISEIEGITGVFQAGREKYYDVEVNVEKDKYYKEELILVNITIINKGDIPDADTILVTYLLAPDNKTLKGKRQYFEEVPPTCKFGNYDFMQDICIDGFNYYEPNKFIIQESFYIPDAIQYGEWRFYASYYTEVQSTIIVYDTFEVRRDFWVWIKMNLIYIISFIIVAIIIYLLLTKRGEKHESGSED